jgi:hypothetical protein
VLVVCRLFDVLALFGDCAAVLDLVAWSVLYPSAVLLALKQDSNTWRSLGRAAVRDVARGRNADALNADARAPAARSAVHTSAGAPVLQQHARAASLSRPIVTDAAQGHMPRRTRGARFAPLLRRLGFNARDDDTW